MSIASVLVLPGGDAHQRARLLALIADTGGEWTVYEIQPDAGPEASRTARTCAAIGALRPPAPLVIAAAGPAVLEVPAVARAQAAAHRRVAEYVLVDPAPPAVTNSWPDAPVTVSFTDADDPAVRSFRLRGWTVLIGADPWSPAD